MRRLSEINKLPVCELTDEEIVKASMKRLSANMVLPIYNDGGLRAMSRYKDGEGRLCLKLIENKLGLKVTSDLESDV